MNNKLILPPLGHRIIKTAAAVFICLLLHMLVGYRGSASQAAIAAIICMQPYVTDSKSYAVERVLGTLIGLAWGLLYLLLMRVLPGAEHRMLIAYTVMSVFVLISIYSTVLIRKSSIASLVAIVYLCLVIDYPEIEVTLSDTLSTVLDTIVGTLVAVAVNVSHLPRRLHPERLFFVRTRDLTPDRYAQIPSSVHITLDHLYNDGAKICLVSRWAPAFVIGQMGLLNVNAPVIVMDGAGLYDMEENKYLEVIDIPHENAALIGDILRSLGTFCSYYTVRDRSLCIYRSGTITEAEKEEYDKMKRSPYRNYMEGMYAPEDRIAFIRVIDTPERINTLYYKVMEALPKGMFRVELREEPQFPNYRGLYFYDSSATMETMKQHVKARMEAEHGMELTCVNILPKRRRYSPESDAMLLLGRLKTLYEPVGFPGKKDRPKKAI